MLAMPAIAAEKPTCAFLLLHVNEGATNIGVSESKALSNRFTDALALFDVYDVLDPGQMARTISMQKGLGAASCTNLACAIEYGKILNVDYVIFGTYGHIGDLYSVETILVDVESSQEIKHVATDYKGDHTGVIEKVPLENLKTLFGIATLPPGAEAAYARSLKPVAGPETQPVAEKPFRFGPRLGLVASDDGVEFGGGIEARRGNLSLKIMGNDAGIGGAVSYYLNVTGNSPYLSVVGASYDEKNKGLKETGTIYGLMLGYRLMVIKKENMDVCIGLGAAYVDWDHRQRDGSKKSDQEFIPVGELTFGYMF